MIKKYTQLTVITALFASLTACGSYQKKWPSLKTPLPKQEGRTSKSYRPSTPTAPQKEAETSQLSLPEALKRLAALPVKEDSAALEKSLLALEALKPGTAAEDYDLAWTKAQLYMSRLSQYLSDTKDVLGLLDKAAADQEKKASLSEQVNALQLLLAKAKSRLAKKPE